MKKRLGLLAVVAALGVGASSPVALGAERAAQETTGSEDDGGSDWGWVGLLGLGGLAGLLGLRRRDDRDRYRTEHTGTERTDVRR